MRPKLPIPARRFIIELYNSKTISYTSDTMFYAKIGELAGVSGVTVKKYVDLFKKNVNIFKDPVKPTPIRNPPQKRVAKKQNFKTDYEYQDAQAKERGYEGMSHYVQERNKIKQNQPINKKLSNLLQAETSTRNGKKTEVRLELGVSLEMFHRYLRGTAIPSPDKLEKLFEILNLPYNTIDDILEEVL